MATQPPTHQAILSADGGLNMICPPPCPLHVSVSVCSDTHSHTAGSWQRWLVVAVVSTIPNPRWACILELNCMPVNSLAKSMYGNKSQLEKHNFKGAIRRKFSMCEDAKQCVIIPSYNNKGFLLGGFHLWINCLSSGRTLTNLLVGIHSFKYQHFEYQLTCNVQSYSSKCTGQHIVQCPWSNETQY